MIGLIKKFSQKSGKQSGQKSDKPEVKSIPFDKIEELIGYFVIGQKLSCFPEYKEDLQLDTIIVGYMLDDEAVYSASEVQIEQDSDGNHHLYLARRGERVEIKKVEKFSIMVPAESHEEDKLDYDSKAELRRTGMFRIRNSISLISSVCKHGTVPVVDSTVRRNQELKEGVYTNLRVALLDLVPESLALKERRKHTRVFTKIPATLRSGTSDKRYQCNVIDFCETSARMQFDPDSKVSVISQPGRTLILDLPVPECNQYYSFQGSVMKIENEHLVINLEKMLKAGTFRQMSVIDALEVKATLLSHPASSMPDD
ncbi:hypothetical protein BOW53_11540 [Solemya pervernicosa gill symbiont]|uniref:PilZ domain-containing protein n=2 Tax=Gammaproteobacteria incertae sedis TaxID=118884 RepID=A0A1T2L2X8_9GAMM|nr:PilZ domain-containing protein [Candidatus Reidiella endopervernicosa]OOZ39439.1 hypothetical protein BOW53_11540 [Solemya pervernicosa gill symbiont]QKQ26712.1 PilZ domain-containing protein [Candidatus Reidiella endopervernicosa]